MIKIIQSAILSIALVGAPNLALAASDTSEIKTAMISQALSNPVTGETLPDVVKICNDSKMACVHGMDTCCDGTACPADGVCP